MINLKQDKIYTQVVKLSATNFLFKNYNEQFRMIENFARMINSITVPIQILCTSEEINPEDWKLKIHSEDYYNFLKDKIEKNKIVQKQFSVVVSHHDQDLVDTTIIEIIRCIKSSGLEFEDLEHIQKTEFVPDIMRPDHVKVGDYYCKTLYVINWPYASSWGWLDSIYNSNKNIDVSMILHPVVKDQALKYLNRKLAQNVSNSILHEDTDEINSDQYDETIASGIKMREELFKNDGKFFFMSYYITVKSKDLFSLNRDYNTISTILSGNGIEFASCYLRQDDGYRCTMPFGNDFFDKKYNFTTNTLKPFFPFMTSNIVDKNGVLIGENLLNSGLIFLDPFKQCYNSALMFVLGKVGSGKTYLIQLYILRLLSMGVKVDIWDENGEYLPLQYLTNNSGNLKIHKYHNMEQYKRELQRYIREMDANINKLEPRYLFIDEFWRYLEDPEIAKGINHIALTGRKKYQGLCVITQLIEHMIIDDKAIGILKNASIKALMQMDYSEAIQVQKVLGLTDEEVAKLVSAYQEGILFAGSRHVQFKVIASEKEHELVTTDPREKLKRRVG